MAIPLRAGGRGGRAASSPLRGGREEGSALRKPEEEEECGWEAVSSRVCFGGCKGNGELCGLERRGAEVLERRFSALSDRFLRGGGGSGC